MMFRFGKIGLLAAVVALVSQLALGAVVLADDAAPDGAGIICDGAPPPDHGVPAGHTHRPASAAIVPLSVALALPSVALTPAPVLPAPARCVVFAASATGTPGCGKLPATARVGTPRGPPIAV